MIILTYATFDYVSKNRENNKHTATIPTTKNKQQQRGPVENIFNSFDPNHESKPSKEIEALDTIYNLYRIERVNERKRERERES